MVLLRLARRRALLTGRRPLPAVAAVLHVALSAVAAAPPRPPPPLPALCATLFCAPKTAAARLRELQHALLTVARQQLPWVRALIRQAHNYLGKRFLLLGFLS